MKTTIEARAAEAVREAVQMQEDEMVPRERADRIQQVRELLLKAENVTLPKAERNAALTDATAMLLLTRY